MEKMSEFWSVNEGTFYCLYDRPRTLAFRKAIRAAVRPGDVVVELGAGTGVLSMFAADAGASKVYAVELDEANLASLASTVAANGYDDRIDVMRADATSVDLPEQVDVIICEMVASGLLEELQIPAMDNALRFAKPDTRVVLQEYHVFADLVNHKNTFYGKRFNSIRYEFPDKSSLKSTVLSDNECIAAIDFRENNSSALVDSTFSLTVDSPGVVNGLRISANTVFCDGSEFGFSVSYSFPVVLPIDDVDVVAGDRFDVSIAYSMCEGPQRLDYTVTGPHR